MTQETTEWAPTGAGNGVGLILLPGANEPTTAQAGDANLGFTRSMNTADLDYSGAVTTADNGWAQDVAAAVSARLTTLVAGFLTAALAWPSPPQPQRPPGRRRRGRLQWLLSLLTRFLGSSGGLWGQSVISRGTLGSKRD
jgi:hypothetical protein